MPDPINPNANLDVNNLHPGISDPIVKYDEATKGFASELSNSDVENLATTLASLEARLSAAGA
jgi:hypothetical protein